VDWQESDIEPMDWGDGLGGRTLFTEGGGTDARDRVLGSWKIFPE